MTGFGYNVLGFGSGGTLIISFTISSSTNNFNLLNHIQSNFNYNGSELVSIFVTIDADVVIGSSSSSTASFITGSIGFATTGSLLTITNNGTIRGAGGRGGLNNDGNNGRSTNADGNSNKTGGDGGTALQTTMTTIIDNTNGTLAGGGGGGGA